jgi:glycosyltransferase involved in cell wall biosynthesis
VRILQVSNLWSPGARGGAELYASTLAAKQQEAGHTVGAVTFGVDDDNVVAAVPPWPYRADDFASQPSWKRMVFRALDVYNPLAARSIRRAVKEFEPDVIHSHNVFGLSTAAMTGAGGRVPHVHHVHDYWLMCRLTTMTLADGQPCHARSCEVIADARNRITRRHPPELLVAPSHACIDAHSGIEWAKGRFRHLPYSVGREFEAPSSPIEAGDPVTFGYIGTVSPAKGVDLLLRAFAGLGGDHRLLVAGAGELDAEVAAAGPRVTALGFVRDEQKERFFADVDCLVVPSRWPDTAPQVVPEARSHGVPVIGARIGGIPELVGPRTSPLLFEPGDADDLARSLERFVADPKAYVVPGDAQPQRLGLSWPDHVKAVDALYEEAISLAAPR